MNYFRMALFLLIGIIFFVIATGDKQSVVITANARDLAFAGVVLCLIGFAIQCVYIMRERD